MSCLKLFVRQTLNGDLGRGEKMILFLPLKYQTVFADELGDSTPELKLSLFQLGVSPQIAASILMQVSLLSPYIKFLNQDKNISLFYVS